MNRIKSLILLFSLFVSAFTLVSCSETDDTVEEFPDWQSTNDTYFNKIYTEAKAAITSGDTSWKIFSSYALNDSMAPNATDHIVVKVIKAGTGSGCPLYTDTVRVDYRGHLLPSTSYSNGYVFVESYSGDYDAETSAPVTFGVSAKEAGLSTALQHMHIGDRWLVYIPYNLGYGTTASTSPIIPAYSTLIYDLTLVSYYRAGVEIPDFKAKQGGYWVEE